MKIKVKKFHEKAVIPKYATFGAAAMDLTITDVDLLQDNHVKYYFGLGFEIPDGYAGFIVPRSSCYKQSQILSNCIGVIDSDYRGEVSAVMIGDRLDKMYQVGERAAQIFFLPVPKVQLVEVDDLNETKRGVGGYGSTGK